MVRFCTKCGKPLSEGETCSCSVQTANNSMDFNDPQPFQAQSRNSNAGKKPNAANTARHQQNVPQKLTGSENHNITVKLPALQMPRFDFSSPKNFIASMKDNMGIGDPESNRNRCYEEDMKIVPDNLRANDGEIPVKQYRFAILRTKMSFMKAKGRLQITNKRLIFRAPGRSLVGRTILQDEFDVMQIHGIRAQSGYRFSFLNLLASILMLVLCFGISVTAAESSAALAVIIAVLFSLAGLYSFFCVKKRFFLKGLLNGVALSAFAASFLESDNVFLMIMAIIFLLTTTASLVLYCWSPDLQFIVDSSTGTAAMVISRERGSGIFGFFGHQKQEATGYREVYPDVDAERAIREINTIISDLQTMGDLAVDKWKE